MLGPVPSGPKHQIFCVVCLSQPNLSTRVRCLLAFRQDCWLFWHQWLPLALFVLFVVLQVPVFISTPTPDVQQRYEDALIQNQRIIEEFEVVLREIENRSYQWHFADEPLSGTGQCCLESFEAKIYALLEERKRDDNLNGDELQQGSVTLKVHMKGALDYMHIVNGTTRSHNSSSAKLSNLVIVVSVVFYRPCESEQVEGPASLRNTNHEE